MNRVAPIAFAVGLATVWLSAAGHAAEPTEPKTFRAGAAEVDITPTIFPVIVNGMFEQRSANTAHDRLMSRALVLDDGQIRLAIVVVDNLMMPRDLLDHAKELARQATGIPVERMLISATHTHSAPSAMGCLGSDPDKQYQQFLPGQIARSIAFAAERLTPARIGWTVVQDDEHNHCRRWVFRPDRMPTDPFGQRNVRANMHPGYQSPNHIGPSGPADTDLTLVSVQSRDGKPLAMLGNYAMHYYGSPLVSGDFCGRFGARFAKLIGADQGNRPLVGMMSQGTSGDSMWYDYSRPANPPGLDGYTEAVARVAQSADEQIKYQDFASLAMAESRLTLRRRVPDEQRLAWARQTLEKNGDKPLRDRPAVYAREQIFLHEQPEVELKLQAIRIGDLGIAAIPDEVYGITGWKLKGRSPLATTFNIELANGAEGYIPPPEQHKLGGYTTWPARTAGLEVEAEPKIVAALLDLLEKVAGKPRRTIVDETSEYAKAVLASRPTAFWRLGEIEGQQAADVAGQFAGRYEDGVALYLPGDTTQGMTAGWRGNRAAHFAGGRMQARIEQLGDRYSVEGWIWNGLAHDARPVTGYFFSRGVKGAEDAAGDHIGVGGTHKPEWAGKLIVFNGNRRNEALAGRTALELKTWHHVVFTRDGQRVAVYLNGNREPELAGDLACTYHAGPQELFVGGRSDNMFNWEGKLDELALYNRALTADEAAAHYIASGHKPHQNAQSVVPAPPAPPAAIAVPDPPPKSPAESLAMIHVREGFEVELVAAEPLVMDPVAIDWGPDGKLWVAEMADYPLGIDGHGKPGGRIRFLEDTSGDGRYDKSTVFLDSVDFPTGVMAWGRGVLVTAAPEIFYAEDTDGNGQADLRRALFVGFLQGNQQLRVNGLRWGLDNWVYCASGSHHGGYGAQNKIKAAQTGAEIYVGSRDFRIQPDSGQLDPLSGPSQFGRNRDDWGHWFGVQNSLPLWHYVLEDRYTRRNPLVVPPNPKRQLLPTYAPVFAAKPPEKRFHGFEQSGHFTSACSAIIYRDRLLFTGMHSFTCEPFHNLVQHNVLEPDGVSFRAARDPQEAKLDFFASEDRWCRPVMATTGPDGALWIVDMYRFMIEHPEWLPPAGKDELRPFYRAGDDCGRIYRVFPRGKRPTAAIPRLDRLTAEQLVDSLNSSNGWQRDTAQRLLIERQATGVAAALEKLVTSAEMPLARLHALCTLDGLHQLQPQTIEQALRDAHPEVRRNALRLAESREADSPGLVAAALRLVDDPDPKVRLQLACSLGEWNDPRTGPALARLALENAADEYIVAAVTSSVAKANIATVLAALVDHAASARAAPKQFDQFLNLATQLGANQAVSHALAQISESHRQAPAAWQFAAVASVLDGLKRRDASTGPSIDATAKKSLATWQAAARKIVVDARADESLRIAAVPLLARQPPERDADLETLRQLLIPQTPADVQSAVVTHLAGNPDRPIAESLLAGWKSHGPALRNQILAALASRQPWVEVLVDRLESGAVSSAEIDAPTRQRLTATKDKSLRARLEKLFASATSADRRQVLADFRTAISLTGDVTRGATLFQKKCATCHKLGDVGHDVGPNLASLSNKSPEALLVSILDPSSAVDSKYLNYIAITTDGRSLSGILATETGASITLLAAEGKRQDILRSDVEELQSSGKSLMPDGLEKDIQPQDLADLIEFVAKTGAAPK